MLKKLGLIFFVAFLFYSCGQFSPTNDKIASTSDGSYVIETSLSNAELANYNLAIVYRFQSVPNLVAVHQNSNFSPKNKWLFSASNIAAAINNNVRIRNNYSQTSDPGTVLGCTASGSAYYEAHFCPNAVYSATVASPASSNSIGVVDSGVIYYNYSPIAGKLVLPELYATKDTDNSFWTESYWLSHATEIASLFVGASSNPTEIYAPSGNIVSVKVTFSDDPDSGPNQAYGSMQLAVALDKAVAAGAKVVNLSLSYDITPDANVMFAEKAVMSVAAKNGVFFVAAAGNGGKNIDSNPIYPAEYNLNNLIVVGSHTQLKSKATSSNYGNSVDISAQGDGIHTTDKYGNPQYVMGTSFAVPLVASALSTYLAYCSHPTTQNVVDDLFSSAHSDYVGTSVSHYGRLDAYSLLQKAINRSTCQ